MHLVKPRTDAYLTIAASVAADALAEARQDDMSREEGIREAVLQLGFLEAAARERGDKLAVGIYRRAAEQTRLALGVRRSPLLSAFRQVGICLAPRPASIVANHAEIHKPV